MKKVFEDENGNLRVQSSNAPGRCGIVELMHLWDKNKSGCVIGYWEVRDVDGFPTAEFRSVHDRFADSKCSNENLMSAVRFGQKLADLLIETGEYLTPNSFET